MATLNEFTEISKVAGVDQFILVHPDGRIACHEIKHPQTAGKIVFSCGQTASAVGKAGFSHILFSRKNRKNLFIFPVGSYYLGVIKQTGMDNAMLTKNIVRFLRGLHKKKQGINPNRRIT